LNTLRIAQAALACVKLSVGSPTNADIKQARTPLATSCSELTRPPANAAWHELQRDSQPEAIANAHQADADAEQRHPQ